MDGLSKPHEIAQRLVELGYGGAAVTDHGNLSGAPAFAKAIKDACRCSHQKVLHQSGACSKCGCGKFESAGLKPILGEEFYVPRKDASVKGKENWELAHLCVLAKNQEGWKNLIRASSASYLPEFFYRKPRLDLERLAVFGQGQFIVFSGHMGSDLANVIFEDYRKAYGARTYEEARSLVRKDWREAVTNEVVRYQTLFGAENFYLEIQLIDWENLPASLVVGRILRDVGKKLGVKRVATADSHYVWQDQAPDHRVLLCSAMDTTLQEVKRRLENDEDVGLAAFFRSNRYHIPSLDEMKEIHEPDELACSLEIAERCESYEIGGAPLLPKFDCPDGLTPEAYMKKICVGGWKKLIEPIVKRDEAKRKVYADRVRYELDVLNGAGLAPYFLIVWDYIRYTYEELKSRTGFGRGSGAGCLASYLMGITRKADPVKYDLWFERFYNAGRNSPGRVALPDIDTDFRTSDRDAVIAYARRKYGDANVAQMRTFSRMQGRGALKDVLRVHGACSPQDMNLITAPIPDESEISDDLQGMLEETGESSIIRWALLHNGEALKEWCVLKEDGSLDGPYAPFFGQAMRLEGTYRHGSRHPSGVIISPVPIADVCPMVWDKSSEQMIVGVDMKQAELLGLVKFDILGVRVLDKLMDAEAMIRGEEYVQEKAGSG